MARASRSIAPAAALACLAGTASAQPQTYTNLGSLLPGMTQGEYLFVPGQIRWFKFEIAHPVSHGGFGFLDIDTNGGTYTGADTQIALYDSAGNLRANNDDSGPSLYSMLSFGRVSPTRPGLPPTGNATTAGSLHAGSHGGLVAGTYWLCVAPFATTWGPSGWSATTTATRSGSVVVRIEYAPNPVGYPFGVGFAAPGGASCAGAPTLLGVTVTGATTPPSTGITVTADMSAIGGPGSQAFYNDGTHGDAVAGDAIWSFATVQPSRGGTQPVRFTVADAQHRSSSGVVSIVTVACSSGRPADPTDLGAITIASDARITERTRLNGFDIKWFKFDLREDVSTPCAFLDLWTVGVAGGMVDTEIGLYTDSGELRAFDDNQGSTISPFSLSELSFGSTGPSRATNPGGVGGNGRDGTIGAGVYYLALTAADATFHPTNWFVSTNQASLTNTGLVDLVAHVGGHNGAVTARGTTRTTAHCSACVTATIETSPTCGTVGTVAVRADLSSLGGPSSAPMGDDSAACDGAPGNNIYATRVSLARAPEGTHAIPISAVGSLAGSASTVSYIRVDRAGDSIATAGTRGDGTGTTLTGSMTSNDDVDIHAICVFDTSAAFSASVIGGASFDSQLFLFDGSGAGVLMNDDAPPPHSSSQSLITGVPFVLPSTVAYLAIAQHDTDPLNATRAPLWNDDPRNTVRPPDNPLSTGDVRLARWTGAAANAGGDYTITLVGATLPCPADYDDGTGAGSPDCAVTIADLVYFLDLFEEGHLDSDLDDHSGTGTRDCGIDVADLLYFLTRFDAGC